MAKLRDYPIMDFSGGLVTNKSDYELNVNEFVDVRNLDLDERGRAKRRRGSYTFGTSLAASPFYGVQYLYQPTEGVFLVFTNASNADCYRLFSTSLSAAYVAGATSMTVEDNTLFAASGTLEVDGDLIGYTAKPTGTTFTLTGASVNRGNFAGNSVNQWSTAVSTSIDSRSGIYATTIGPALFVTGRTGGRITTDGQTFNDVATSPNGLFAVTYRDRVYVAGSNAGLTGSHVNQSPVRVSFSNAGIASTWTSTDYFDVYDDRNEMVTGLKVLQDNLLVFKQNSTFSYNEAQLKQRSAAVGAYNHHVVQEIDGVLYTFCPSGIYQTNGSSFKKISEPVEKILKLFYPTYDSTGLRVINNCFAGVFDKKYILYLGNLTNSEWKKMGETVVRENLSSVCLVYDTLKNNWTIYALPQGLNYLLSAPSFASGGATTGAGANRWQGIEALFGLTNNTYVLRMFEDTEVGYNSSQDKRGSGIAPDDVQNNELDAVSCILETSFIDHGNPSWWKKYGFLRVLVEMGNWNVFYKLDKGTHITDWIPLGNFNGTNTRVPFPQDDGYRIKFKITSNEVNTLSVFNGIIIEDTEATTKDRRGSKK